MLWRNAVWLSRILLHGDEAACSIKANATYLFRPNLTLFDQGAHTLSQGVPDLCRRLFVETTILFICPCL